MNPINELTAIQLREGIDSGTFSPMDIVETFLQRITEREPVIRAWEFIDPDSVRRQVKELGARQKNNTLWGIPVGIKDISNTSDMPTSYGSPIYREYTPPNDAAYVSRLRQSGAIIMGKTVTTEFAYFEPSSTANPINIEHTPGGSSSGSAAAVADFMVPIAFGTQVAGSLIRPASYCGILGYKPTFGLHSPEGIKGFSHSLSTLGWMTRSAEDLALVHAALTEKPFVQLDTKEAPKPKIAMCKTYEWAFAETETINAIESAMQKFDDNGACVSEIALPSSFTDLLEAQKNIMAYEAVQNFEYELHNHVNQLSESMLTLLDIGKQCTYSSYVKAQEHAAQCRTTFASIMAEYDALLTPSAPGEAPYGLEATGDPVFNRIWTLLHVPTINIPGYVGTGGLPVGVQLVGKIYGDQQLLLTSKWCYESIVSQ